MKYYWEKGKLDSRWVKAYCFDDWMSCVRYQKEETGIEHPDYMLPDGTIDENLRD